MQTDWGQSLQSFPTGLPRVANPALVHGTAKDCSIQITLGKGIVGPRTVRDVVVVAIVVWDIPIFPTGLVGDPSSVGPPSNARDQGEQPRRVVQDYAGIGDRRWLRERFAVSFRVEEYWCGIVQRRCSTSTWTHNITILAA